MKAKNATFSITAMAAAILFTTSLSTSAYQLEKRSEETFSVVHTIKCADGKVHWIRQEKKTGKWCYDSRCFNSVADLIRSQISSCK